jgi:hypothetical protein
VICEESAFAKAEKSIHKTANKKVLTVAFSMQNVSRIEAKIQVPVVEIEVISSLRNIYSRSSNKKPQHVNDILRFHRKLN